MSDCPHKQIYGDYNLCYECGKIISKNEIFCETCDKERIERLDKQFNKMAEDALAKVEELAKGVKG